MIPQPPSEEKEIDFPGEDSDGRCAKCHSEEPYCDFCIEADDTTLDKPWWDDKRYMRKAHPSEMFCGHDPFNPKNAEWHFDIPAIIAESTRRGRASISKQLNEMVKINADATAPADGYHTGLTNGLECAAASVEGREPKYLDVVCSEYKKGKLEAIGVMEKVVTKTQLIPQDGQDRREADWREYEVRQDILSRLAAYKKSVE